MVSDLNSRSDLWADPSITRNAVGKYRCDRLIPPLRSSGSDLYGRDRQYKNTQFIKKEISFEIFKIKIIY